MSSDTITVGRSDQANVIIEDETISRLHLELTIVANDKARIRDLNSANGTYILKSGQIKIDDEVVDIDQVIIIGENYQTTPRQLINSVAKDLPQDNKSPFSRYIRADDGQFKRK